MNKQEFGRQTRRRPIGRDYAVAEDAKVAKGLGLAMKGRQSSN